MKTLMIYILIVLMSIGGIPVLLVISFFIMLRKWNVWCGIESKKYHNDIKNIG